MSSAEAPSHSTEHSAAASRLRMYLIAAWACGWTFLALGAVSEFLTNTHAALLPTKMTDFNVHLGFTTVGTGCFALALWLQAIVSSRLTKRGIQHTRSLWPPVLYIVFVVIASLLLATSVISLIALLSSPVSAPLYNIAVNGDTVAIFANFGWATLGLVWWAIQRGIRDSRTPE